MADGMQDLLARDIETLRADVLKAGVLNAKALQDSAETHVAHLHDALRESSELADASFQVVSAVIGFAKLLYSQSAIAESERARQSALAAIDRLAAVMGRCEWRQAEAS
ncbi:hypothetical protein [Bosea sp. ANAM02]|uniref:hypothetical protein n=1 Tax=Bosea sp. ANAM02 TaxID=2020412 RepID=UPI000645B92C|nr:MULTISPECIES: hypothetical protein [Hyphomicrobiales]BCB20461.1 hypothetical protein OCUBac02_33550 [Bosea sp. ANAM02]